MTTPAADAAAETIGQRLRRLRTERRLSQRELSSPGVSYAYISRIEAGTRQPSVKALRRLARKLGVTPEYLETGSELGDTEARELEIADAELQLRLSDDREPAEQALARLLDEAVQAGDGPAAARIRIGLGLAAAADGRFDEAVRLLEHDVGSGLVTPASRPDVYVSLGRSYAGLGRAARAVELFEDCLAQVDQEDPDNGSVRTRFATYLSYALTDVGDLGRAEAVVADAIEGSEDVADPYTRVRLYWSRARLASLQGRAGVALDFARRAVALLEATEDSLHLGRAHLLCAAILNLTGSAERAEQHLAVAERLLGQTGESDDLASLRSEQARAAASLGRGDDAIVRAREALELLGEDDPAERGNATWALAEGLALTGELDDAFEAFGSAVDLLGDQGRWREASQAARAWARLLREQGREADALDVLERATDLAVRFEAAPQPK